MAAINRAVLELGCRVIWILDPAASHRQRCARVSILELVSLGEIPKGALLEKDNPDHIARKELAKANFRKFRTRTESIFNDCDFSGDAYKWSIEGEEYPRWTAAAGELAKRVGLGIEGEALYNLMSISSHPQGYTATFGVQVDDEGVAKRIIRTKEVESLAKMNLGIYYSCLASFSNYFGSKSATLRDWEQQISVVFPDLFR